MPNGSREVPGLRDETGMRTTGFASTGPISILPLRAGEIAVLNVNVWYDLPPIVSIACRGSRIFWVVNP